MGQIHWMFSLLPDSLVVWIYYLFTILGLVLYVGSKLVKLIPLMGQYKLPAELSGVAVLVVGSYLLGGFNNESGWRERVREMQAKVEAAETKSKEVTTVIQTKVVERVKIVEKKVEVVKKEIQIQKEVINAQCTINDTAIDLYNKAVADPTEESK